MIDYIQESLDFWDRSEYKWLVGDNDYTDTAAVVDGYVDWLEQLVGFGFKEYAGCKPEELRRDYIKGNL